MRPFILMLQWVLVLQVACGQAATFEVLAEFSRSGTQPLGPLVRHADGNYYGTTVAGGASGLGTVFRMTPVGGVTTLASFSGAEGAAPDSNLVVGGDGALYGLATGGGSGGYGTAFRVTMSGALTSLVSFTGTVGPAKGSVPGGLILHGDGQFYGLTLAGGGAGHGTLFKLTDAGAVTTLVEFTGLAGAARGAAPLGPLAVSGSTLYGVTREGGAGNVGTVFKTTTAGVWTLMAEFSGTGGARPGANPSGGLCLHPDGALYGSTEFGGSNDFGTVFRITTAAAPVFASLRSFADPTGSQPAGTLGIDGAGVLVGGTAAGGAGGLGTLFKMTTVGTHTVLADFAGTQGAAPGAVPRGGVIVGTDGAFYGTTSAGGPGNLGVAFRVTTAGVYERLASFSTSLGWTPAGAPVVEASGTLLFPMAAGGEGGVGTLVRLPLTGGPTVAAAFSAGTGGTPVGGLVLRGSDFVGVTSTEGGSGRGAAYQYSAGNGLVPLASFSTGGGVDAEGPLLPGVTGDYFGVSREGGLSGNGTLYRLTGAGVRTRLISFTGSAGAARGRRPRGPLALAGITYYGVTEEGGAANTGTLFRLSPAGVLTTLADFAAAGPRSPSRGLVAGGDGFLYGTTAFGGAADAGTIIRLDPTVGAWSVVAEFSAATGSPPTGPLLASGGSLYGQTAAGGAHGAGSIFRYASLGGLTTLVSLSGNGGSAPGRGSADDGAGTVHTGGLVAGPDGQLYGVAAGGGSGGGGIAFRLRTASPATPFDSWKSAELGDPTLPDGADPDGDGLSILLEYALNLQPRWADAVALPAAAIHQDADGARLHMVVTRDPGRSDISLLVQAADDLHGPWSSVASSVAGAPFSGAGYVGGDSATPGLKTVEIRDIESTSSASRRFMRLKINH